MRRPPRSILPLFVPVLAAAQNIVTSIAGGDWIFPATPIAALNAPLSTVTGLALAANGDLLIADGDNAIVLRLNAAGTATVVAGNGIIGYSGDGGPATRASLAHPSAVAADAQGNIYISDAGPSRVTGKTCTVRKVSAVGTISTVARCDSATVYTTPQLSLDAAGNLFLVLPQRILRVLSNGAVQPVAGVGGGCGFNPCPAVPANTPALSARFNFITSGAFDSAGNLYLADLMSATVYKLSTAAVVSPLATGIAAAALSTDRAGNLYAADLQNSNSIKRIATSNGVAATLAGNGTRIYTGDGAAAASAGFQAFGGLAVDSAGQIYVADGFRVRAFLPGNAIRLLAGNGRYHSAPEGVSAAGAAIYFPTGVATDSAGNVYFGEYAGRIRCISAGALFPIAGNSASGIAGDGGPALAAAIGRPQAIAVDAAGALYFTEWNTGAIRKIANGIIRSLPKPGIATGSSLFPGIAVDRSGNVYVASFAESQVFRITPSGAISVFAGTGKHGYNGDNIAAVQAQLNFPQGLAIDSTGNLYIGDGYNNRIRKVTPAGIISTVGVTTFTAQFVAVDGASNVFAADQNQVWRLSNGVFVPYTNGIALSINGIAADTQGNLYIANSLQPPFDGWESTYTILKGFAAPPVLTVAPAQLSFQAIAGGPPTAPQTVTFTGVTGLPFTLGPLPPWLTAPAASARTAPSAVPFVANPASLAPGAYTASVPILAPGANVTSALQVTFNVTAPVPTVTAANGGLSFTLAQGAAESGQPLVLANTGAGAVSCNASASAPWLSVAPTATLPPGAAAPLLVTVNPAALAAGVYSSLIVVTCGVGAQRLEVPVTLTILSGAPSLSLSQSGLGFTTVAGVAAVPSETFWVINRGGPPAAWTAAVIPSFANWLSVSPSSGTAAASARGASPVVVSVNAAGLAPGTYQAEIAVSAAGWNASLSVVLNVLSASSAPPPLVRPAGLLFTSTTGSDPGSQQITITNRTARAVSYASGRTPDTSPWFTALPSAASIPAGQSQSITIQTNASALAPGLLRGALTLLFDDGSIQTVSILRVTFAAPAAASTALRLPRETAAGCAPSAVYGVFTSPAEGDSVTPGQPATLGAVLVDDCGAPLETGAVRVHFSDGEPPLDLNPVGDGYWETSWAPARTGGLLTLQLSPSADAPVAQLNLTLGESAAALPAISRGGVVSAADPLPLAPLARGGLIAIYGAALAGTVERASTVPLPAALGDTQVLLNGQPLPLLYVSPNQIDAVIPYDAPTAVPLPMVVRNGSRQSLAETVVIAAAQPAAFLLPQFAPAQAAAVGPGGLATDQTPVRSGDRLIIYAEGLGPVTPPIPAGAVASFDTLHRVSSAVAVTIGGRPAVVEFAGLAPGAVAEYQINVVVPDGLPPNDRTPLVIMAGGATSPTATIAVR